MEYGLESNVGRERLLSDLNDWNRLEELFLNTFGEQSLKDKQFRKLKLERYTRLYDKYKGRNDLSKDEGALLLMVHFQSRNIRKILYPGLLNRLLYRVGAFLTLSIRKMVNKEKQYDFRNEMYADRNLSFGSNAGSGDALKDNQAKEERYEPKMRLGADLGVRNQNENGQRKGPSI